MAAATPIEIDPLESVETTLVELVLAACEWSEDQGEIADLVDWLVAERAVRLVPERSGANDAFHGREPEIVVAVRG